MTDGVAGTAIVNAPPASVRMGSPRQPWTRTRAPASAPPVPVTVPDTVPTVVAHGSAAKTARAIPIASSEPHAGPTIARITDP